jgi:hypothetical protein
VSQGACLKIRPMRSAQTPAPVRTANRSILLVAAAVVALLLVTVAVVLIAGNRSGRVYPANSPEGTLQHYLASFDEGDYEAAYAAFSNRVHQRMALDEYERAIDSYGIRGEEGPVRQVLFDRTSGGGDRVDLHLVVEEFSGQGLGASTHRSERVIRMIHEADGWRIDASLIWLDPGPFVNEGL